VTQDGPSHISVRGAREHNLKDINVDIPRGELVVVCGVSGSGKSTLAFDTVYAEGQRRYVESLSAYARQFLGQLRKPDVDSIEGLSPAVAIDQKSTSSNPRSTVGTVTEIHDHLRLLWARVGQAHCVDDGSVLGGSDITSIVKRVVAHTGSKVIVGATVVSARKGTMRSEVDALVKAGFVRGRLDGRDIELEQFQNAEKNLRHDLEVIVDRISVKAGSTQRLRESLETAMRQGAGTAFIEVLDADGNVTERELCSLDGACAKCGKSWPVLEPRTFSFNSPFGACEACDGLGSRFAIDEDLVVPDKERSIAQGAISPWQGMTGSYQRWALTGVCKELKINVNTPWKKLPATQRELILRGEAECDPVWQGRSYHVTYENVEKWLTRRAREAETDKKREHAAQFMRELPCQTCAGRRLSPYALGVTIADTSIAEVSGMTVQEAHDWFEELTLTSEQAHIAERLVREIEARLGFLCDVGLEYVTLDRSARTLSGGEAQRIRLASQVGAGLAGVLYVLDEPSIGLHPQDNKRLITTLRKLRDLGNTVLVVEHDEETIDAASWVIEVGPHAGEHGGEVVFEGTPHDLKSAATLTGEYLSGRRSIATPATRRSGRGELWIKGAVENNLKALDVRVPLGCFVTVAGVSGSGKSTLISDILQPQLARELHGARALPGRHKEIVGVDQLDKCINIDQAPIGRTPRSNPATYTGVFDKIRALFGDIPESKARGWKQGRFSFNVPVGSGGGRCEACAGEGTKTIEMNFLPDVHVPCTSCDGRRFAEATLEVKFKEKSIADVLEMTVDTALEHFAAQPSIARPLQVLSDVGLGYVRLGQSATQLSGGEAQRVKLAAELQKRPTGKTLYLLDEPTTGLHFDDVSKLVGVLQRLVTSGNSVVVIEHNIDVLRASDWIIELGPKGGHGGGLLVAEGTPEHIATCDTATAGFVKAALLQHPVASEKTPGKKTPGKKTPRV
jgi:excinuclease ABC subunit A